jgi:hypothetical protein
MDDEHDSTQLNHALTAGNQGPAVTGTNGTGNDRTAKTLDVVS